MVLIRFRPHQASLHMDSSGLHFARARSTLPCAFIAACDRLRLSFHRVFPATSGGDVDFFSSFLHCPGAANFNAGITEAIKDWHTLAGEALQTYIPGPDLTLEFLNRNLSGLQKFLASKIDSFDLSSLKGGLGAPDLARVNSACENTATAG